MKRGSAKKKVVDEQPLNFELGGVIVDGMDEASDPFQEISLLASAMRPSIPIDQIPGPARASRAAPIIENPQSANDSDSVDDDESVRSEDFNNLMNQYQNEFRGKNQNYASRLPKGVNYLLGEANRLYLERDFSHSIEVIYEELGDLARAVDFLFIETQLNCKSDTSSWCKLADRFFKLQSFKNAGYCYGRALKCEKNNIELLYKKAQCYDKLKDVRGAVKYYEKIHLLVPEQKEVVMKLGKLYVKVEQQHKAVWLMIEFLSGVKFGEIRIDFDVANVCCELMVSKKRECAIFIEILQLNPQGLDSILNAYKFFKKSTDEENSDHDLFEEVFTEVQSRLPGNLAEEDLQTLKDELPVEIIVKYAQCLLNHSNQASKKQPASAESKSSEDKSLSTALDVLSFCEEFDPAEYHDAFIDMIDLYFEFGYLEKSTQLCERLYTASNETDRQEILLRLGFLFGKLGDWKKEMEAYERVLKFNPENKKARFRLSEIYETNGFYQDALKVLKQPTLIKEGGALSSKKHDQKREVAKKNSNLPDLALQKHQSEITFGGGDMLESEDDDRQDSSSSHPSLGKRTSGISQDYDQLGRENNHNPNPSKKNFKVEGLIKDINNESEFNSKTRRRMVNIVELNEQFFINIQTNIEEMLSQFDLERLLLDFKQSELGLKSDSGQPHDISEWDPKLYSSIDFRSIKKALKLELKKDSFKENIYQLLLNESKGRIRSAFQGAQLDAPEDFKKDLNTLFIFKRKKQTTNPENSRIESWLKESKNKSRVARNLAQKLISKMKTVPDFIGFHKFVDIVDSSIKVLYQQKKYVLLSQICEVLYKISKVFAAYPDFQVTFYNFGFLANCRIQNFEKAYIFFRVIGKNLIQEEPGVDENGMKEEKTPEKVAEVSENPLARLMQIAEANTKTQGTMEMALSASKPGPTPQVRLLDLHLPANFLKPELQIHAPNKVQEEKEVPPSRLRESFMKLYSAYSQSTLNLVCFTMINHLFNEFSSVGPTTNSHSSNTNSGAYHHRLFFQKFQKQFESGKQLKYFVNLISANNYIGSGSTGPAKECLLANGDLETSPLTNFLLGFIVLTESTNRNKENKVESVHEAFEYFERYKELSPASKLPEVYYNLGRALSHLNMPDAAMRMFAKNRTLVSERLAESRRLLEAAARQLNKAVDWTRFEAHCHQVKLQHLYYEAAFNQLVWKQKLHRDGLAFENLRSIFCD